MLRSVDQAVNIADLRRLAQRRLPRLVFDYADGGAEDEITLRDNCRVFDTIRLRPRNGILTPRVDLRTTVLGTTFDLPFLLAPIGSTAAVPSARRGADRRRGRRGRRRLHPVDALRIAARRGQGRSDAAGVVPALPGRRARRRARRDRARPQGRLLGIGRHHRHAGRRDARARPPQRHRRAAHQEDRRDAAAPAAAARAARHGWPRSSPTAG